MSKPTKVPRATLAITMLDDPEFIGLCQTAEGREAYALFTALLMAAKDQDNGGKFTQDSAVLAMMVRWPVEAFRKALALLQDKTNWLIVDASLVQIRSYKKWNSWGGNRDGAGRPIKTNSSCNQDGHIAESKPDVLAVVVASKDKDKRRARKRAVVQDSVVIPDDLKPHEGTIRKWLQYRSELRKPVLDASLEDFWKELRAFGADLPAVVHKSIAAGWQGLFALKPNERKVGVGYESEMETYNEPDKYGLAVTKRRYWRIENGKRTACFETRQAAQGL